MGVLLEGYRGLYMGTPEMSADLLSRLIEDGVSFSGVVTNPDRPVGRRGILTPSPVKSVALLHGIPVFQPERIRKDFAWADIISFDFVLTFSYGQIVPMALLSKARLGAYNVHGSLLPEYRGAAPIQRAIMDGHEELGASLMEMVQGMDAGRVYGMRSFRLPLEENYGDACRKMVDAGLSLVREVLPGVLQAREQGEIPGVEQDESLVTFAPKILPEEERIPFEGSARKALDHVRALAPRPGAHVLFRGAALKVYRASLAEGAGIPAGHLYAGKGKLLLSCADGSLSLETVQLAGKKETTGRDFLNGARLLVPEKVQ